MRIYSVSEYREEVNELLAQVTVAIEGEISSYNMSQNRFVWFSLSDGTTLIDCFMMAFALKVPLAEGMRVRIVGSPTMFKKGKLVFQPRQVELVGDGDLQKSFELLKAQLEKEGLFNESRKRALPRFPEHIGLVTSRDAAAYTDIIRVLTNRFPALRVTVVHVQVQGSSAVGSVVAGLEKLYAFAKTTPLDCIVISRGGGSMEDLQAFNAEEVVRAVFQSPVPTVAAIGHERDTTLIDLVADVRAATPSNAAELLTPQIDDVIETVDAWTTKAQKTVIYQLQTIAHRLDMIEQQCVRIASAPMQRMTQLETRLRNAVQLIRQQIASSQQRVGDFESLLRQLHPEQLLKKGFTITRDANGRIIKSAAVAQKQASVTVQFADGSISTRPTVDQ